MTTRVTVRPQRQMKVTIRPTGKPAVAIRPDRQVRVTVRLGRKGDVGPEGPEGPEGPAGGAGYTHDQLVAALVWNVQHNFGFKPGGVMVEDSAGTVIEGNIQHIDDNNLTITFSALFGGKAYIS